VREHERAAKKSNRGMRGRVDSPMLEGRNRARGSVANTKLPDDQEEEAMTQCENGAIEHERVANTSLPAMRRVNQHIPTSKRKSQQ